MSAAASALAQVLAEHDDEAVLQAVQLLVSQRPHLQNALSELVMAEPAARYTGVISCFYPEKGFGFIKSDDAHADFGFDTFLSDKELGVYQQGSVVSFSIALNSKNQPQARLLAPAAGRSGLSLAAPPRGRVVLGVAVPPAPAWTVSKRRPDVAAAWTPAPPPVAWMPAPAASASAGDGGERHEGVITCYYPEKTFGFIQCEELKNLYGMDTYLSSHEIGNFSVGDSVSFRYVLNKKGSPQARDLQPPQVAFVATPEDFSWGGAARQSPVHKRRRPDWHAQESRNAAPGAEPDAGMGRLVGTIKVFYPEKKFGFIASEEGTAYFGIDTFVSNKEIGAFGVGDAVEFSVAVNRDGKPQARELVAAG